MCYYEQTLFSCGDFKWGHFKQHCHSEYRIGETCGRRLIFHCYRVAEKCKICQKIDTKYRRRQKEVENILRWQQQSGRKASIESSQDIIAGLDQELRELFAEKNRKMMDLGGRSTGR